MIGRRIRSGPGRFSLSIFQSSVPPPVLATVSGWLVDVLVACVFSRLNGLTSMLGSSPPLGWHDCTVTSSTSQPGLLTGCPFPGQAGTGLFGQPGLLDIGDGVDVRGRAAPGLQARQRVTKAAGTVPR